MIARLRAHLIQVEVGARRIRPMPQQLLQRRLLLAVVSDVLPQLRPELVDRFAVQPIQSCGGSPADPGNLEIPNVPEVTNLVAIVPNSFPHGHL